MSVTSAFVTRGGALSERLRKQPLVDLGLIVVRGALAWIFIYHGAQRLFGWWHGGGISAQASYFANVAHLTPGKFFAALSGATEFFGGISVALGVLARLGAFGLVCDMVIAMITVAWKNGIISEKTPPGYELNLALAALAVIVVCAGAGRVSVDTWLGRRLSKRTASTAEVPPTT